ncbi:MAG: arylsulfatase [Kiritimatiellales bacterium]|nr:arylsulfatase [Kiritimatiellales bacterium]
MSAFSSANVRSLLLLGLALGISADPSAASNRPNILVVLVDDLGWSDIAPYGSEIHTPTLDTLAANGLRFRHFYNEARCSPTRAALMTGLHMQTCGIDPSASLPPLRIDNNATIPEILDANGYRSYFAGKWHLGVKADGRDPISRGFGQAFGPGVDADGNQTDYWADGATYGFVSGNGELSPIDYAPGTFYTTDAYTDYTLKYLDYHFGKGDGAPFFIYQAFNAPHWYLEAPKDITDLYTDIGQDPATTNDVDFFRYEVGWDMTRQLRYGRQLAQGVIGPEHRLSPMSYQPNTGPAIPAWNSLPVAEQNDLARRMAVYAAMVHRMDWDLGRIVARLEAADELDNTLIFFLSDNGGNYEGGVEGGTVNGSVYTNDFPLTGTRLAEMGLTGEPKLQLGGAWANVSNTPLRFFKHHTHEGGCRTPMIMHWPAGMSDSVKGSWTDARGHAMDIMATILDITGINYPAANPAGYAVAPLQGTSLKPVLQGGAPAEHDLFIEHERNRAMFRGKWKLVTKRFSMGGTDLPAHTLELYNMEVDPSEMNNLAFYHTDLLAEMVDAFNAWVNSQTGLNANRLLGTTAASPSTFAMPLGTELFYDTFDRPDADDIDAARDGISGTYAGRDLEPINATYFEGYGASRTKVVTNRLRLAISSSGMSETGLMMDFNGQDIIDAGGFSVELAINEINSNTSGLSGRYVGFGVGLTQAEAAGGADIGQPGNFRSDTADCFVELDLAGHVKLSKNGVLAGDVIVGATNGTLLAAFALSSGFGAGEPVNVTVYFNGTAVITNSFAWDSTDANYLGLSAHTSGYAEMDNLIVRTLPLGNAQAAAYALDKGLSGSDTDRDADPDGDGTVNWAEWAWGTDPATADHPSKSLLIQADGPGQIRLLQRQLQAFAAAGLHYRIFYSSDLSTPRAEWTELAPTIVTETTDNTDAHYAVRTLGLPPGLDPEQKLFFILTAEQF